MEESAFQDLEENETDRQNRLYLPLPKEHNEHRLEDVNHYLNQSNPIDMETHLQSILDAPIHQPMYLNQSFISAQNDNDLFLPLKPDAMTSKSSEQHLKPRGYHSKVSPVVLRDCKPKDYSKLDEVLKRNSRNNDLSSVSNGTYNFTSQKQSVNKMKTIEYGQSTVYADDLSNATQSRSLTNIHSAVEPKPQQFSFPK